MENEIIIVVKKICSKCHGNKQLIRFKDGSSKRIIEADQHCKHNWSNKEIKDNDVLFE